ncbi:glutaredoxin family protein [bacterium]|nr:glutaredoxin family protein [bacterium]
MYMIKVDGKNRNHKVKLYTLSTCGWCKKMKKLLKSLDIEYEYTDIDLLEGEEDEKVRKEMKKHNSRLTCPTLVVDDGKEVIIGFKEDKVRGCFENDG